jgi:hypothetical protein
MQKSEAIKLMMENAGQVFLSELARSPDKVSSQSSCEVHSWIIHTQKREHCNLMTKETYKKKGVFAL